MYGKHSCVAKITRVNFAHEKHKENEKQNIKLGLCYCFSIKNLNK